ADAVGSMLSAAANLLELDHLVVLVVAVGIAQSIQAAPRAAIGTHVETAKRVQHALHAGHLHVKPLDLRRLLRTNRRRRDAAQPLFPLIADDDPALVIEPNRDP